MGDLYFCIKCKKKIGEDAVAAISFSQIGVHYGIKTGNGRSTTIRRKNRYSFFFW